MYINIPNSPNRGKHLKISMIIIASLVAGFWLIWVNSNAYLALGILLVTFSHNAERKLSDEVKKMKNEPY